jgi:hypothetical protein
VLVPTEGEPALLVSKMHAEIFDLDRCPVTSVFTYVDGDDPSGPLRSALAATGLALRSPGALPVAWPVIALWILAPAASWWLSQPIRESRSGLSPEDVDFLRTVARRTWRFFETFVGPDDNDLPPDNFQEDPPQGIAHRTSPTNIGLSLLANLAAYDFGYVPAGEVIVRTERNIFLGEPSPRAQRLYDATLAAYDAAVDAFARGHRPSMWRARTRCARRATSRSGRWAWSGPRRRSRTAAAQDGDGPDRGGMVF